MPPSRLRPARWRPSPAGRPGQQASSICRGQDRQSRAGTLRLLRREQRRVEW
jgi:hypothetical protein